MRIALVSFVVVLILAVGGVIVVAQAPFKPSVQKVEQVVPDEKLPH